MATLIVKHKHYPSYKPSGIEWLGDVPAHWEVRRASRLFSIGSGTTPPSERSEYYGGDIPWVTTSELRETIVTSTEKTITEEALRNFPTLNIFPEGSIAVAMYGATIGRLGILGVPATVNQACCVFSEPKGMNAGFWFFWLQSRRHYLTLLGQGGGQPNLSQKMLRSIRVPTPPLGEQAAIAVYLDRETAQIDALVTKKERLIELLQEKRTALISHTVTKGLNTDAPMTDSGIELLGEIPAHWEVKRLRYTAEMRVSNVDKHTKVDELPVRLCNYVDVYNSDRIAEGLAFMPATATLAEIDRFRLQIGDVLITKDSETWNDIGVPALVEYVADDLICGYHLALLRPASPMLSGGYLLRALQSPVLSYQFHVEAKGVTRYGLTHSSIKSAQLPIPPLDEQTAIASFLDRETARLDSLISKVNTAVKLLEEFRTALISAAVTGKIDVREDTECT